MWPFKKKKQVAPSFASVPCNHKYREFAWYKEVVLHLTHCENGEDYGNLTVKIYKPYVCIHCKHRKNILLDEVTRCHISWSDTLKFSKQLVEDYPGRFKPQAVIESEIADFQLIDREYLKAAHELFPDRGILKEAPE
jgi:hypothetical protein